MSNNHQNQSIALYSQIFVSRPPKDSSFYANIYTTPVHPNALKSVLVANAEDIGAAAPKAENIAVMREFLASGLSLLADAMNFPCDSDEEPAPTSSNHSRASLPQLDGGGDDITSLNGRTSGIPSAQDLDGDDITTLNGKAEPERETSSASSSTSRNNSVLDIHPDLDKDHSTSSLVDSTTISPSEVSNHSRFRDIDEELRIELISNILTVIQTWFVSLYHTNTLIHRNAGSRSGLRDVTSRIFQLPGSADLLNDHTLMRLLTQIKWYCDTTIDHIQNSSETEFKNLGVIKEIIHLLGDMLKSLLLSISLHKESTNEFIIIKSLIFSFFKVELPSTFDRLLQISNGSILSSSSDDDPEFSAPKIILSPETLSKVLTITATLANLPSNLLPLNSTNLSSDITNLTHESPNSFEHFLAREKVYNSITFKQEIASRYIPILAMDFSFCYNFREDLLVGQIQNSSFMNWLTGNRFGDNLYVNFDTVNLVTDLDKNYANLSLLKQRDDPYLAQLKQISERRAKTLSAEENEDHLELPELLPLSILLTIWCKNPTFMTQLTEQRHKIITKVEDIDPSQDTHIELFEIWLCVLSYVFQYQYRSENILMINKLSLSILLKLTSPAVFGTSLEGHDHPVSVLQKVKEYNINEFKWKLNHQKSPIIPNDLGKYGIKSSLFYILDIVQNLIRYNLTKKLNIESFKLALNVIYQILTALNDDTTILLERYSWVDFYTTIFNFLKFIKRQKLSASKYFISLKQTESLKSLVEEIFIILNFSLLPRFNDVIQYQEGLGVVQKSDHSESSGIFRSINYDLIYNILLNYEAVNELLIEYELDDLEHLNRFRDCLEYFEEKMHLTEESKLQSNNEKLDLIDLDFDSPELVKIINEFTFRGDQVKVTNGISQHKEALHGYKYPETMQYVNRDIEATHIHKSEIMRIISTVLRQEFK